MRRFIKLRFPSGAEYLIDEYSEAGVSDFALSVRIPGDRTWMPVPQVTFECGVDDGYAVLPGGDAA